MVEVSRQPDYTLILVSVAILLFGILILTSVSAFFSQEKFGNTYYFLNHQLLFGLLPGITLAFLAFKIRLELLKRLAPILLLINLVLLFIVFLPRIGMGLGGATRWISLGKVGFQPSEFLKLTFILYLAAWLTSRVSHQKKFGREQKDFGQTLVAFFIIIILISLFLIFQPDISTLGVIVASASLLYFSAGTPLWHILTIILAGMGTMFFLIKTAPYRLSRFQVFFNPELDPMGIGYQIKQALIAVGSGGIFGLGLGMSRQKFGFLPQSISDAIFAILAEETGFLGSLILILLFLIFFWQTWKIASYARDKFSQLVALGIGLWIIIQAFVNIGSMIGILPLAGIPLPFISYGGSHLVAELIGVGILLNISKHSEILVT